MNWKSEAIDKLRGYEAHQQALVSIPKELELLRSRMMSIRSAGSDGSPSHGGGNGREDMLITAIVKFEELERQLKQAKQWCELVDGGLNALDAEQRKVLDAMYIKPRRNVVDWLCDDLCCEKSTVYRKRDDALRRFVQALYGVDLC